MNDATDVELTPYWEPQRDMRCGLHAVNGLLGGPRYEHEDMLRLARDIVEDLQGALRVEDLVAESGFYDAAVLERALMKSGLTMQRVTERRDAAAEVGRRLRGVLMNRGGHWCCARRLGDRWWDLDSTMSAPCVVDGPEAVVGSEGNGSVRKRVTDVWRVY